MFHPVISSWFEKTYGEPTEIQSLAWPAISGGEHVLISAPTGSGKTLTAFLFALDRLLTGAWPGGAVRILYVSPLKALNNDIKRNLVDPLAAIRAAFAAGGVEVPGVHVMTRSGDTPQEERRRMLAHPPEILITTPESLNLILSSPRASGMLAHVRTVILDEIHAVAGAKRGAQLMVSVERLARLSGEFQRIGISATVRPIERVARLLGGYAMRDSGGEIVYEPRRVSIVESQTRKRIEISVRSAYRDAALPGTTTAARAEGPADAAGTDRLRGGRRDAGGHGDGGEENLDWNALADEFRGVIHRNRSTLLFTNNRRHAEKIALIINEAEGKEIVYSHHGSLSREIRSFVESELKSGNLSGIVATSSLELGIDIGALDEVVLVGTPFGVASALQRVGRAGHRVGEVSRGIIYPLHGRDYLNAAVMVDAIKDRRIEELHPIQSPLDVLAQTIISMSGTAIWNIDEMFAVLRASDPFHELSRRQFNQVLEMLAGRYADARIRELNPRVSIDRLTNTVRAREGALTLLYHSGGTIPDRGYYDLRVQGSGTKVGDLDEEFVWERRVGETFTLGAQAWKIVNIGSQDVEVIPSERRMDTLPFWKAETVNRDFEYSDMILRFLERWNDGLTSDEFRAALEERHQLDENAADELAEYLVRQREMSGADLPHRHHLLIEHFTDPKRGTGAAGMEQIVLHTLWGGRVNRPFALALSAAWEEAYGYPLEVFVDNDAIMLMFPGEPGADDTHPEAADEIASLLTAKSLVTPENIERHLRRKLESSGYFGAMFRENAGRALLLPRSSFRRRMPLWLNRVRSKKLLSVVTKFEDFPILLETWRTCMQDEFDLRALSTILDELTGGAISTTEIHTTTATPFAAGMIWQQTNKYMYEGDEPLSQTVSSLGEDVLREVMYSPHLRPRLDPAMVAEFERKLQRTAPGLAPTAAEDLVDWVRERVAIPRPEWDSLAEAATRDYLAQSAAGTQHLVDTAGSAAVPPRTCLPRELAETLSTRIVAVELPGARSPLIVHAERVFDVLGAVSATDSLESVRSLAFAPAPAAAGEPELVSMGVVPLRQEDEDRLARYRDLMSRAAGDADDAAGAVTGETRAGAKGDADDAAGEATGSLRGILEEVLRFYGPRPVSFPETLLGIDRERSAGAIAELKEDDRVLVDEFTADASGLQVCDAGNLEALLRLARRQRRPEIKPLPPDRFVYFHALRQGLIHSGARRSGVAARDEGAAGLKRNLERLFGYPLSAELWEREVFPARLPTYYCHWIDALIRESGLVWMGTAEGATTFLLESDLDMMEPITEEGLGTDADAAGILEALRGTTVRKSVWELSSETGIRSERVTDCLWRLCWAGMVSADSYEVVRKGIAHKYRAEPAVAPGGNEETLPGGASGREMPRRNVAGRRTRVSFDRWKASRPTDAGWFALDIGDGDRVRDPIQTEELARDRARMVLARCGIVFQRLLERELPSIRWQTLFRSLRVMELSGEVVSGYFFEGIPGIQFALPGALRMMEALAAAGSRTAGDDLPVYWMNAVDPASPCGLGLGGLPYELPTRISSNHLVFEGPSLVMVSRRVGSEVEFTEHADSARIPEYLEVFRAIASRDYDPAAVVRVETVNGEPARNSRYGELFIEAGFRSDFKGFVLHRTYR